MLLQNHQELKFTMPRTVENVKQLQLVVAKPGTTTLTLPTKLNLTVILSWIQFSRSVMSDSLRPMDTRLPCPSPTPGIHLDSRPSSRWCHPTMSSSVIPFSSCPQSLPASESFPMNESTLHMRWPKYCSFSFSISPSNEHPGLISFRRDWLYLLAVQGLSRVFTNTTVQKWRIPWTEETGVLQSMGQKTQIRLSN